MATQRSSWQGAFSGDLWLAQTHGSRLASSRTRSVTLGHWECLFKLWMVLQRKVVIFVKAISQVGLIARCLTNSSSYQDNKFPASSRVLVHTSEGYFASDLEAMALVSLSSYALVNLSLTCVFPPYFCCPLLLLPLTPISACLWRHSDNMQLMVLCQVLENNAYTSCSYYEMFHFNLVQYGKQWVTYRTHIDWHKILKGKSDMDLMYTLIENSVLFWENKKFEKIPS